MKTIQFPASKLGSILGGALLAALTGCTTYIEERPPAVYVAPQPVVEYVAPAPPVVVIQTENDFYQPLTPYGRWVDMAGYGRVWMPDGVAADWHPYSNGHWEYTEAGWFWASDEPWAWATYHYGGWDYSPALGWFWVPQTQWAPAWVAWRSGGGYAGWAPLPPPRMERGARVEVDVNAIAPRSFVFVEESHFTEPHRAATVIVNNTEIVNKTVVITTTTIVNKTVINAGPRVADIGKAAGHPVPVVAVKDLRTTAEAHVAAPRRPSSPAAAQRPVTPNAAAARPASPPANSKPIVAETDRPKPSAPQPARPASPPAAVQRPVSPKAPEARPASPPAKPGTPAKPENKDDKKKPDQP